MALQRRAGVRRLRAWVARRLEGQGGAEHGLRWERGSLGRGHPLVFVGRGRPPRRGSLQRWAGGWHGLRRATAWRRLMLPHYWYPKSEPGRAQAKTTEK